MTDRHRNLGEALTEVGKTFGFESVSHVVIAWKDDRDNIRVSILPYDSLDSFGKFMAGLVHFLEHPDESIKTDLTEYSPRGRGN